MSFDQAFARALALEPPPPSPAADTTDLTPRELEVTRLVAGGSSNLEVATELVIAETTAARHVANIFSKLGFHSRAQIAAWYANQQVQQARM